MKLTKNHQVLVFKQSHWLKPYTDFNTENKKKTNNEFEKILFKIMNNSVYGKTMENLRNGVDKSLVTNSKGNQKLGSSKFCFSEDI